MQTEEALLAPQRYQQDGFYICTDPLIPLDLVERAVSGMDAVRAENYDTGIPPRPSRWNPGDDPNALCKIEKPQIANRAIMELVSHPALGEKAAEVSGARAVQVWWVQLLYKPPSAPGQQPRTNIGWHQDYNYWGAWEEESELFTAWVALSDVAPETGPMNFVARLPPLGTVDGERLLLPGIRDPARDHPQRPWPGMARSTRHSAAGLSQLPPEAHLPRQRTQPVLAAAPQLCSAHAHRKLTS